MRKETVTYSSPIDALVAVTKRFNEYDNKDQMDSEHFSNRLKPTNALAKEMTWKSLNTLRRIRSPAP